MKDLVLLGDPHLGRRFKTGVPLHRTGDREAMVWADFEASLRTPCQTHICMGDIFDKSVVPISVVLRAADIYIEQARHRPGNKFIVIRGNHDVSRDVELRTSFDLFKRLVSVCDNIKVVDQVEVEDNVGFVPYCPFTPVADQIEQLPDGLDCVFMHHDYVDFGGAHVIPTKLLASKRIMKVVNGHDHIARVETRHGVEVTMTGSMQPYSHAEDPEERLYITTTLDRLGDVRSMNVRLILRDGEVAPEDLDCLSLIIQREQSVDEVQQMDIDTLDVPVALAQALEGLSIKNTLLERFHDHSSVS